MARRGGQPLLELALKMALVGKAQLQRHLGNPFAALEQLLGTVDALVDLVGVRSLAVVVFEVANQLVAA